MCKTIRYMNKRGGPRRPHRKEGGYWYDICIRINSRTNIICFIGG
jgi:hypothetical protein